MSEAAEKDATLNSASPAKSESATATKAAPAPMKTIEISSEAEKKEKGIFVTQSDAPPCPECGTIMVRAAACYKCLNCGTSSGCS